MQLESAMQTPSKFPLFRFLTAFWACTFVVTATPSKEALLIANGQYSHFGSLANPLPDAERLGVVLEKIGFRVSIVRNGSREDMLDALKEFETRLRGTGAIAFFHYGGHGLQVNGRNYLIPADADIPDERRVATRSVDLDEIMGALDQSNAKANVVVLDACRDNPLPALAGRTGARGLSVVGSKPKNSIIIYAAEAGNKAMDGLFTPILASALETPGRTIDQIMKVVRSEVHARSHGQQTPGEYNQLFEDLFLSTKPIQSEQHNKLNKNELDQQNFLQQTARVKSELANQSATTIGDAIAAGNLDLASSALERFSKRVPDDSRIRELRALLGQAIKNKEDHQKQAGLLPVELPSTGFFTLGELFKGSPYTDYNASSQKIILQKAQESLRKRNFYFAPGDGNPGPKTQKAIIDFQKSSPLPVSGRLDSITLAALKLDKFEEIREVNSNLANTVSVNNKLQYTPPNNLYNNNSKGEKFDIWSPNYKHAINKAATENCMVLLEFTGSDWCPPCIKQDKEVFTQTAFEDFARSNIVAVKLDFPRRSQQSNDEKATNENLARKYNIEGFPTLILLDSRGVEIAREVGYGGGGGVQSFISWVNKNKK